MKSIFTLLLAALAFVATAQPQKIHYQGVAVGTNGKPIKNSAVGLRLSVLDSLPTGTTLYTETQTASTDASGQFSIYLGGGTATAGTFSNLPWANGNDKFLKVEMDAQGGSNYQPMGTTQLVSVPYAMAAGSLREGALLYGNHGQQYQINIDSMGPKWTLVPPPVAPFSCGQAVNYAGESYPTVQIGTQCWFAKNLNVGTMITWGSTPQINNGVIEKYCQGNDSTKCTIFGGLYVWAETVNYQNGSSNNWYANPGLNNIVQGICPIGWHLPNSLDWNQLVGVLGGSGVAGGALKSSSVLWIPSPYGGIINNNSSGFSALPSGYFDGPFRSLGYETYFWTSNETSSNTAAGFTIQNVDHNVYINNFLKYYGYSVRCLKD